MQRENIPNPIYVQCDNMYDFKVCSQKFGDILSGLDIQLKQSENEDPACKKLV